MRYRMRPPWCAFAFSVKGTPSHPPGAEYSCSILIVLLTEAELKAEMFFFSEWLPQIRTTYAAVGKRRTLHVLFWGAFKSI